MNQLLCGNGIVKSFGAGDEKRCVLDGVSVEIGYGEFTAVMGPSGSGKSTLLYALSGMDRMDGGRVSFEGRNLSGMTDDKLSDLRRDKMGFIFQQPTLLKSLNILDNIILPRMRGHRGGAGVLEQRARQLMKQVGIEGLEQRETTQVSGGQLQRAGICRALMNSPKILFGDEPTGALNSKAAGEVMELLSQINADGTAILLVTHDAGVAARAERVLFLCDGKIVSEKQLGKWQGRSDERKDGGRNLQTRTDAVMSEMRRIGI